MARISIAISEIQRFFSFDWVCIDQVIALLNLLAGGSVFTVGVNICHPRGPLIHHGFELSLCVYHLLIDGLPIVSTHVCSQPVSSVKDFNPCVKDLNFLCVYIICHWRSGDQWSTNSLWPVPLDIHHGEEIVPVQCQVGGKSLVQGLAKACEGGPKESHV